MIYRSVEGHVNNFFLNVKLVSRLFFSRAIVIRLHWPEGHVDKKSEIGRKPENEETLDGCDSCEIDNGYGGCAGSE